MASTPEAKVKKKVVELLKAAGAYYFFPATGGYGRSGVPDIVACWKSVFIGIECKAGNNKPTALQVRELQKIQDAGGVVFVVNDEALDVLTEVFKGTYISGGHEMSESTPETDTILDLISRANEAERVSEKNCGEDGTADACFYARQKAIAAIEKLERQRDALLREVGELKALLEECRVEETLK